MSRIIICLVISIYINQVCAEEFYPKGSAISKSDPLICIPHANPDGKIKACDAAKRHRCTLAIDSPIQTSGIYFGSFFGSGKRNDYQLPLDGSNVGPVLAVRSRSTKPDENMSSQFYAATSVYSTCDVLIYEFELIDTTNPISINFPDKALHKLTIKLKIFYSAPNEGEFPLPDLQGQIFSSDASVSENIVLLRGFRYKIPAILGDQNCAKQLNEMSKEICDLFFDDFIYPPWLDLPCNVGISGETEPQFKYWKEAKENGKLTEALAKQNYPSNICPNNRGNKRFKK